MASARLQGQKSRELRRRVILPVRIRTSAGWGDACILNVSSRGLMLHSKWPAVRGHRIEVRYGDQAIVGHVVWRSGSQSGLRSEQLIPILDLMAASGTVAGQPRGGDWSRGERRGQPRAAEERVRRAKALEFVAVVAIGASFCMGAVMMVQRALAQPMSRISDVL